MLVLWLHRAQPDFSEIQQVNSVIYVKLDVLLAQVPQFAQLVILP